VTDQNATNVYERTGGNSAALELGHRSVTRKTRVVKKDIGNKNTKKNQTSRRVLLSSKKKNNKQRGGKFISEEETGLCVGVKKIRKEGGKHLGVENDLYRRPSGRPK